MSKQFDMGFLDQLIDQVDLKVHTIKKEINVKKITFNDYVDELGKVCKKVQI